jgi:NAD(P)-dependent dehydrogenase (short-subunit alcohol dehydrogenase family)
LIADLRDDTWRPALEQVLRARKLYGIVHAAWPGLPHGGLLQVEPEVIEQQLNFGVLSTTELARFLFTQSAQGTEHQGGRLIVLSSTAATRKPVLPLASYSLGKAALEHTARLLAPELARRKITINVVCPSFIAVGMNKQSTERQQLKEEALIPLGRLCRPDDVAGLVQFLLSPEAAFISGEIIGLTGAQI